MGFEHWIAWIAEVLVISAALFAAQLPLRLREHPVLRTAVFSVKLILIPGTALLFVAVENGLSYRRGDLLTALYLALLGDTAASAVEYALRRIRLRGEKGAGRRPCRTALCGALSLVFCFCVLLYGAWNVRAPVQKRLTLTADGLTRRHAFAFVSDIHAGSAQSEGTLRELCGQINAADPEFVI